MRTLTADDINAMIDNQEHEGASLEFKKAIPAKGSKDKVDFLRDAAAMANGAGGVILYGVDEKRTDGGQSTGIAGGVSGVHEELGPTILRLEQTLNGGIEPRLPGRRFYPVEGFATGPVLALEIPRSWLAPHMVCVEDRQEFYSRHSKGNFRLDVAQIRAAFLVTEGLTQRVTRFRDERLGRIAAGDLPVQLDESPRIVHIILPVMSFGRHQAIDLKAATSRWGSIGVDFVYEWRLNIDGLLCLGPPGRHGRNGYVQLFRSGAIETVAEAGHSQGDDGTGFLHTQLIEDGMASRIGTQCLALTDLGIEPPFVVCGAVLNAKGCKVPNIGFQWASEPRAIDREVVILPEVTIEDVHSNLLLALTPLFEAIYEAGGWFRPVLPR